MRRMLWTLAMTVAMAGELLAVGLFSKAEEPGLGGKVVVMQVGQDDLMSRQSFRYMRRLIQKVEQDKAAALVIELDTPGGVVWETTDLMMNELARLSVPTYAFVNSRAISAGALIAVSTNHIYMAPAASIGAAGVITLGMEMGEVERAKAEGMVIASATSMAALKGHDTQLVTAMIRMEEKFKKGPVDDDEKEIVTLSSQEAAAVVDGKPLLAKGVAKDVADLLRQENIAAEVVVPVPTGFEKFAWWVAKFSPLLILIGLGAGYFELKTPGFGIGGTIALLAFGLFFFGNNVAGNLAGYELLAIFLLGIALIAIELFLLPGTIVPGLVGVLLAGGALLFAMVDRFAVNDAKEAGNMTQALLHALAWPAVSLSVGLLGATVLILLMMRFLPEVPLFRGLVLREQLSGGVGASVGAAGGNIGAGTASLGGQSGVALTDLRPAGKAEVDGRTLDVTCDGFIAAGSRVRVIEESAFRVVVRKIGE